ncbi:MAG: HesA/MoeB/ThiF family protein [Candidatus Woesearchaeota archaeon]
MTDLTKQELERYSRNIKLDGVGITGQKKIKQSKVLIIGVGGLGSPAALYLAAAGVGTIGLVDFDKVEENNLQRQILHSTAKIGLSKVQSAKKTLNDINPNTKINLYDIKVNKTNIKKIIKNYDVVIDATDNLPTKYIINDACVALKKPHVFATVTAFDGQVSVFNYRNGPCLRCLFPEIPESTHIPTCADSGVMGVLPGVIGTIQATETLKIILGLGDVLSGRYLVYNAAIMMFKELNLKKNKNCSVCSK